jgi:hypothetical protein
MLYWTLCDFGLNEESAVRVEPFGQSFASTTVLKSIQHVFVLGITFLWHRVLPAFVKRTSVISINDFGGLHSLLLLATPESMQHIFFPVSLNK